ncbi:MAG TPA: hypothetical protein VK978_00705 [Candidatus Saccharimonadales bacterium]|nr:hypothetical protein [Candidatus Saccharimonadales bacterium]
MSSIQIPLQKAIDEHWYQRLRTVTEGIGETFVLLMPDQDYLHGVREAFFSSGCTANPDLYPRQLPLARMAAVSAGLMQLQADITAQEPNEAIREAYVSHIQDYLTNLDLLCAAANRDHDLFMQKNRELYGMPDEAVFAAACAWVRQDAEQSVDPALDELRQDVLRLVPDLHGNAQLLIPDEALFHRVRNLHLQPGGYVDQLFAPHGLPEAPYIEQEQGDVITHQAIANVGSDYALQDAADGLWAVLSRSRKVVRPLGYRVDRDYFVGVVAHEVGSHLLEEANGSRQPLRLFGLGLNGFEKGNEGRAYLREQIVYPDAAVFVRQSSWEYILMLHVSVGLAAGLHDKPYTFAELYAFLYALHRFWRQRRYPMDTNNDAEAREEAWLLAVRIMKGTNGTGGCYMKDTVYLQGNVTCWHVAKTDPWLLLQADMGKFNIGDEHHLAILRELNLLKV